MKRILVFRSSLLAGSETFIKQQVSSLVSWDAMLVGNRRLASGLAIDGIKSTLITNTISFGKSSNGVYFVGLDGQNRKNILI